MSEVEIIDNLPERVTIDRVEYEDLCNMRNYIYENNLVINYELYLSVKAQVEEYNRQLNG